MDTQMPTRFTDLRGNVEWILNGQYHREDGPAVENSDGYKEWWFNGKLHREDGPAVNWSSGTEFWFIHGKQHRIDGPAVIWVGGTEEWFVNGVQITEDLHLFDSEEGRTILVLRYGKPK